MDTPLSHHRILELVAPLSRAGCTLDLPASDRAAGVLKFKPVLHPASATLPALAESLQLEPIRGGLWRLERQLLPAGGGAAATLQAEGEDTAALLAQLRAVPHDGHFLHAGPLRLALAQRCAPQGRVMLRGAQARVAGLALAVRVSSVSGYPAEIELTRDDGDTRRLPDDLLEVLGRAWTRLTAVRTGWQAAVQLRGAEPERSADARDKLIRTVEHLAATLAAPPQHFHQQHRAARWRVGLLRAGPLSIGLVIVAAALSVQRWGGENASVLGLLANVAPPLLMALFFMRREMPRIELPRWPRQPAADSWNPWTEEH